MFERATDHSAQAALTVATLGMVLLYLELMLIRLFSGLIGNAMHTFAISLGLLGLSLGGLAAMRDPKTSVAGALRGALLGSLGLAAGVPALNLLVTRALMAWDSSDPTLLYQLSRPPLLLGMGLICLPCFHYIGKGVALLYANHPGRVHRLYGFELGGAACGVLLALLIMDRTGSAGWLLWAVFPTALLAGSRGLSVLVLALALFLHGQEIAAPTMRTFSIIKERPHTRYTTKWCSMSQMEWLENSSGWLVQQDNASTVLGLPEDWNDLPRCVWLQASLPLTSGRSVLIAATGIGRQMVQARQLGFRRILGVELNPWLLPFAASKTDLRALEQLFAEPEVDYVIDNVRHYLARGTERYDVVLLPPAGAPAPTGISPAGSYLVTREALELYEAHLRPGGVIVIAWKNLFYLGSGDGVARLLGLLKLCWGPTIEQRTAVLEPECVLVASCPITSAQWTALNSLQGVKVWNWEQAANRFGVEQNWPPITDDFPYLTSGSLLRTVLADDEKGMVNRDRTLYIAILVLGNITASLLAMGLLVWPLGPGTLRWRPGRLTFAGVGAGLMLCEIGLLEHAARALGNPTVAYGVGLIGLLGGLGAAGWWAGRLDGPKGLRVALQGATLANLIFFAFAGRLLAALPLAPEWSHAALVLALSALCGTTLGAPFPRALSLLARRSDRSSLAAAWALNGAAAVMATNLAALQTRLLGTDSLFLTAAVCYLLVSFEPEAPKVSQGAEAAP